MNSFGKQNLKKNQARNYVIHKGLLADRPSSGVAGQLYLTTDVGAEKLYIHSGAGWKDLTFGEITPPSKGLIFMWAGNVASKPAGYEFCDGTPYSGVNNPDLRDKFIKAAPLNTNPGSTGGATSHSHVMGDHVHNIADVTLSNYFPAGQMWRASVSLPCGTHGHPVSALTTVTTTSSTGTTINTVLPVYCELAFIIKTT